MHPTLDASAGNSMIRERLSTGQPFLAARFGMTEGRVCYELGLRKQRLDKLLLNRLVWGVGLYPAPISGTLLKEFVTMQRSGAVMADLMLRWGSWPGEDLLLRSSCNAPWSTPGAYGGFVTQSLPWTMALEAKRVLVVHPFADSIISQYDHHRTQIWANPHTLPEFANLEVLQAPQTIGGKGPDDDWIDTLTDLQDTCMGLADHWDIALVGCGGYGLPLAGYLRLQGKSSIVLGGDLQLLFGIRGRRWDARPELAKHINSHWVRPSRQERPAGYQNVENGCYW